MRKTSKKVCKICGNRYTPNPKTAKIQKTCGADACQQEWRKQYCRQWNCENSRDAKEFRAKQRLIIHTDEDDRSAGKLRDCIDWDYLRQKISPELTVIIQELLERLSEETH